MLTPMLYKWFIAQLPSKGPFVDTKDTRMWSQRLMALTSFDIDWYASRVDSTLVIACCGGFSNVPLIGTKGIINYNPVLALRQLGYPMRVPPIIKEIEEFICCQKNGNPEMLKKAEVAWSHITRKGKVFFGAKESVAYAPYVDWLNALGLPFVKEEALTFQPTKLQSDVPKEQFYQVECQNYKLQVESQDKETKLYLLREEVKRLT